MTIGERICKYRKLKGYSQEQLSTLMNVSRQTVSKWESDIHIPELEKCMELCKIFEISLDELIIGNKVKESGMSEEQFQRLLSEINPVKKKPIGKIILYVCIFGLLIKLYSDNQNLFHQMEELTNSYFHLSNEISNQSSSITYTIEEALKSKDSLISNFKSEVVHYDLENEKVTIRIQVYPKSITKNATMSLLFENEFGDELLCEPVLNENVFEGEFEFPFNEFDSVLISLKENEKTQQMTLNYRLNPIQDIKIFPNFLVPSYSLEYKCEKQDGYVLFQPSSSNSMDDFKTAVRSINLNGEQIQNKVKYAHLEVYVNDERKCFVPILEEKKEHDINKVSLVDGDNVKVVLNYIDSLGLNNRMVLSNDRVQITYNNITWQSENINSDEIEITYDK